MKVFDCLTSSVRVIKGQSPLKAAVHGSVNFFIPSSLFDNSVVVSAKHVKKQVEVELSGYGHFSKQVGFHPATILSVTSYRQEALIALLTWSNFHVHFELLNVC